MVDRIATRTAFIAIAYLSIRIIYSIITGA